MIPAPTLSAPQSFPPSAPGQPPVAVYVHTPFCPSKCGYCDFNSYAMAGEIVERTTAATIEEIKRSPQAGRPAKTIFFGGGTPTFLEASQLVRILQAILETHPPIPEAEITSEANPGTVDIPKFGAMREAGFNRVSLGAQSFDTDDLLRLGRVHEPSHIARAVAAARSAGFQNISVDLMFALPGQSLHAWRQNLQTALALRTDHLSLYCLTIEPNTRFYRHHLKGLLDIPDDETQVRMYDLAVESCADAGLPQYEICNFARPGYQSRHNLCYWRAEEYLAYGPGAVGCVQSSPQTRLRYTNTKHPLGYSERVEQNQPLWCETETIGPPEIAFERLMLGIRLNEGLPLTPAHPLDSFDPQGLQTALERGWIEPPAPDQPLTHLRLSPAGRHFCSETAILLAPLYPGENQRERRKLTQKRNIGTSA